MSEAQDNIRLRYIVRGTALFLLLWGLLLIVTPFLVPLAWALILTMSIWPLYRPVSLRFPKQRTLTAALFASGLILLVLAVVLPILIGLGNEIENVRSLLQTTLRSSSSELSATIAKLPIVGQELSNALRSVLATDGEEVVSLAKEHSRELFGLVRKATKNTLEFLMGLGFCGLGVFFLLRDGDTLKRRLGRGIRKIDSRTSEMGRIMVETVRGTLYGLLLTAVAQGVLGAIGYAVAGVPAPILFGFLTALMSLVPYGTPFVYLPLAGLLFAQGAPWYYGAGLALWGTAVVSSADNVLKPYFIGQRIQMPILLIFIGVLGGLFSFGMIGVFIGPVLIGIGQMLWLEWTDIEVESGTSVAEKTAL